jgi:predicted RNA-binding protein YlxR (DUF448 family)
MVSRSRSTRPYACRPQTSPCGMKPNRRHRIRPETAPLRAEPVRTCLGCRRTASKTELLRIVRGPDGTVALDPSGRAQGRGAYVHPDQVCVRRAARGGALARALKVGLRPDEAGRLWDELTEGLGVTR